VVGSSSSCYGCSSKPKVLNLWCAEEEEAEGEGIEAGEVEESEESEGDTGIWEEEGYACTMESGVWIGFLGPTGVGVNS